MSRETREERKAKARYRAKVFGIGTVLCVAVLMGALWKMKEEGLDAQGCPKKSGPSREAVVLIDASDPLSDKHKAELGRILREMTSPSASGRHGSLAVREGERVTFYLLNSAGTPGAPIAQICNPGGNPEERQATEAFTEGGMITRWRWEQFVKVIESLFPAAEGEAQPQSPILETIAVIIPSHASSRRAEKDAKPTHLIVISDLLQHTGKLSHYRSYPAPESLGAELSTDLSRVEVSLFRLEREKYAKYQTPEHYYWWRDWVEEMEGRVAWQQAL